MTPDDNTKFKNAFWWITSIAVSVLCCSILFVLFASYLVDLKADIRDDMVQINKIEARQVEVLEQIEMLSKRLPAPPAPAVVAPTTDAAPVTPPAATESAPTTMAPSTPDATGAMPPVTVNPPVVPASPAKP